MMRFHSYCPPEAAFNAADKLGFYLQPEGPSWPNHGVKLRRGMTIDRYLMEETQRMVDKYGKEHLLNDPNMQRKMLRNLQEQRSLMGLALVIKES
jgi:hypothetical protein